MSKSKFFIISAILALTLAALACSFNFGSASIGDAWTAFDQEGALRTSVFEQDSDVYVLVELEGAPDDTIVKAVFFAVNADGIDPNSQLEEVSLESGSGQLYFSYTNNQLWPTGDYKVDIYLNDELDRTLTYQVQGSVAAEPTLAPPTVAPPPTKPPLGPTTEAPAAPTEPAAPESNPLGNPNASAPGEVYFETQFETNDNWYTLTVPETDSFEAYTQRETLYLQVDATQSTLYAFYRLDLVNPDVQVSAGVETIAGPNANNISLVCRATETGWYEFSMNSGGYWYIWKYEDSKYTKLLDGASTAINLQKAKNEIMATCINRDLTFYVNGIRMGSVSDNSFRTGGQVGVSVSTFDIPGAGVEFDWFSAIVP